MNSFIEHLLVILIGYLVFSLLLPFIGWWSLAGMVLVTAATVASAISIRRATPTCRRDRRGVDRG